MPVRDHNKEHGPDNHSRGHQFRFGFGGQDRLDESRDDVSEREFPVGNDSGEFRVIGGGSSQISESRHLSHPAVAWSRRSEMRRKS